MPYKTIIDNLKDKQYWCINNSNIGNEGIKYLAKVLTLRSSKFASKTEYFEYLLHKYWR